VPGTNAHIVRRWLETLSATPDHAQAGAAEFWDEDADYYPVRKWPEARPCHGLEEIAQFLAGFAEAWSRRDYEIQALYDVGDDRVLARATLRAEGRGSGMRLEGDIYHCVWLRHAHFFRIEDHLTLRGALHALGLNGETLEAAGL
jgi:SnoaL-like domain